MIGGGPTGSLFEGTVSSGRGGDDDEEEQEEASIALEFEETRCNDPPWNRSANGVM